MIYFLVQPYLPARAQQKLYSVDFWMCLACYGALAALPWFRGPR